MYVFFLLAQEVAFKVLAREEARLRAVSCGQQMFRDMDIAVISSKLKCFFTKSLIYILIYVFNLYMHDS